MKRTRYLLPVGLLLFFALCLVPATEAQSCVQLAQGATPNYVLGLKCTFNSGSAPFGAFSTSGIQYWQVVFTPSGTVSGATLSFDSSVTGIPASWSTGGIIASGTIGAMTSAGHYGPNSSPTTPSNYGQLTPTITGSGSVSVILYGYTTNPVAGGGSCVATVGTLTSACGTTKGTLATVTDGSTTSDCTVGSGTNANACIYTGAAWAFAGSAAGAPAFNTVTAGTNTTALAIGTGGSLAPSGTGTISANQVNSAIVPLTKTIVGTNGSGQIIDASLATLANNTSGTAANLSGTPAITVSGITDTAMVGTNLCVTVTAGVMSAASVPCQPPASPLVNRQFVALAAPLGAGSSSAATVNLTLPTWKSGIVCPGLTGNRKHGCWVQANTADGTSWNYAFKNTTGNIASTAVAPTASGLGGATTDGAGTFTNQGPASCSITSVTISGGNVTLTTGCTLNGSNPLHVGNKVEPMGLTNANDLCLNRTALTVGTVNTNTLVAPTACPSTGPNAEAGTAWVSSNFNGAVFDDFALDLLPYYFQQIQYEVDWVGGGPGDCDTSSTGATAPNYTNITCYDAQFNNWYQDVNFPPGGQISMTISHVNSTGGVNNNTPPYVASVIYAATIINPLRWAAGTVYNWGNAVYDGAHYQIFLGTAANSVFTASGSTPSWNATVGGTTTDGACTACWFNFGTTAPPQMFVHSTAGGYVGNSNTSAFTDGLYWMGPTTTFGSLTVTNIVSACGGCTVADLVTLFPLITNQPYLAAALAFDQVMAAHFTGAAWVGAVAYIRPGQTLNGQGFPVGAAVLKGASFANLTTAQWNTYWISAIGKFQYGYAAMTQNIPLRSGLIEFSPQSSNNPADTVDAPAIADGTTALANTLSLPLSFNGLRAADLGNFAAGTTLYADWAKNVQNNNGSSPQGSVQQAGPGSCVGTTNRLDLNLQLPTILAVHAFEAYSADYWALDPNDADYSYVTTTGQTCSQLYASAIAGFVGIGVPVTEPLTSLGVPWKIELANGQTADALDVYPYSSNGEGTANFTISNVGALTASAMSSPGLVNFSGASEFRPKFGTVASLPGTCTVGDVYEATNATAGQNWYFCTTTNTWTQQLNGGGMTWPGAAGISLYSGSSSWSTSIALNSTTVPQTLTSTSSAASFGYAGVPVDATNPATLLNTDRANYLNWTSGTAFALPAVSGAFASNMPFVLKNTAGSTLTITPNAGASDLIDGAAAGNVLTNFAAFVYQDGTTAPGHWFTIKIPTVAAFGSTCANFLTWSTTTGFGCAAPAPSLDTVTGSAAQATGTETAASHEYTFAGVETAALTSYISLTDANSSNNNSSGAVVIGTTGTSTGAVPLRINEATAAGDLLDAYTGSTVTNGVLSGGTQQFALGKTGSTFQVTDAIGSGGTTQTISAANGAFQTITLSANLTISFTQPTFGNTIIRLKITQAAGGNDTVAWTSVKWPGGIAPVMTAAANAIDWYSCVLDGTSTWCTAGQNFQ